MADAAAAAGGAGKKKKQKKAAAAAAASAAEEGAPAAKKQKTDAQAAAAKQPGKADVPEATHPEDAYKTAAVLFFTRDDAGKVARILFAVEERKAQASYLGLPQKGKVVQRCAILPMGRRERKDKNDTVETARREYVEETGDFGGLAKYLDFADFGGGSVDSKLPTTDPHWTGRHNMAVYFSPASLITLFCEVPAAAAELTHRAACRGVPVPAEGAKAAAAAGASEAPQTQEAQAEGGAVAPQATGKKKRKKQEAAEGPRTTYAVGKMDQLEPGWLDIADVRAAVTSAERAPILRVAGEECRLFPVIASLLRQRECREWLGVPPAAPAAAPPAEAVADAAAAPADAGSGETEQ